MTSSSERVLRGGGASAATATPLPTPDLRSGVWTRLGHDHTRGDAVLEHTLDALADRARQAAHSEGYAVGWAQGMREAAAASERVVAQARAEAADVAARRRQELAAARQALIAAAEDLAAAAAVLSRRLETDVSELAYAVTAAALGEAAAAQSVADVVDRVRAELPSGAAAVVRLHPSHADEAAVDLPASVTVVADAALGPADALVELDESVVDLRVDRALARVRQVLS
ncbi:hypothetical protein D9V37_13735 [Nocardioides mangrovicus]|uniref:Uncharacterized protein n=1 Tax=Nocardioides mangrovicus TaxID=2478913 RepID=A0A3L8P2X4_9ACTN|nr:FliH/SctL family protein [Nocardioides mangrovicus]RLV48778.1 hypothetical protein D9V37_13735 [Nocardioides mangrovicus]